MNILGRLLVPLVVAALLAGCASTPETGMSQEERQKAARTNTQLGAQHMRQGELQRSLDKLEKALRQDPDYADAHMVTAILHERLEQPDKARTHFKRALDLAPLREEAAAELIRTLADRGRTSDAVRLYERFRARRREELELDPSDELRRRVEELRRAPPPASTPAPEDPAEPSGSGSEGDEAATGGASGTVADAAETSAPATDRGGEPSEARASRPARPGRRRLLGGLVTLLALGAAVGWYLLGAGAEPPPAGAPSVAVLPFEALGEADAGLFAEGMHGDLLTRLSNVSGLAVTSATSVARYRGTDLPLPAVADSLGVDWVVEGGVQRTGGEIQVTAQLIDPRTDTHAWAASYRRELTAGNLFDLQGEIARRIAGALEARVTAGERERVERHPTGDLEAYRLYVQGRRHLGRRTGDDARQAVRYFRRAIERDSGYALAWAGLADASSLADVYDWRLPPGSLPEAEEAARRALELAPDLAEAHTALGRLLMDPWGRRDRRDAPAAARRLRRAVELKPSYAGAHHLLGYLELALGDRDRAVEHLELAVEIDPLLHPAWGTLAWARLSTGELGKAMEAIRREVGTERDLPEDEPAYAQGLRDRVNVLYHQGRYEEAARLARRALSEVETARYPLGTLLVATEAARGDTASARRELARMREEDPPPVPLGLAHAAVGDVDAAFEAFLGEETIWPAGTVVWLRYWFPEPLGPIRADPRYGDLVRQIERKWKLESDGEFGGLNGSG
jgi:TolB-like protein/Tfp pilus assembly protein PilF